MDSDWITAGLGKAVGERRDGAVVMLELPAENYMESEAAAVRYLAGEGYGGVFISFQRPYLNILATLRHHGVDVKDVRFVDVASAFASGDREDDPMCVHVSDSLEVDEIVRAVYTSLERVAGGRKFICVDSLTTVTLHKPLSEVMRLSEFLRHCVRKRDAQVLLIGVARDLAGNKFIRDVAMKADKVLSQ